MTQNTTTNASTDTDLNNFTRGDDVAVDVTSEGTDNSVTLRGTVTDAAGISGVMSICIDETTMVKLHADAPGTCDVLDLEHGDRTYADVADLRHDD